MALQLSLKHEYKQADDGRKIPSYKEHYGRNVTQMPGIVASGRTALSFAEIMQRKLDFAVDPFEQERRFKKSDLAKFVEKNWGEFYKTREQAIADWNRVKDAWATYYDSGDSVVYHPDNKEILIVLDSESLRNINKKSYLHSGVLVSDRDRDKALASYGQLKQQNNVVALQNGEFGRVNCFMHKPEAKSHLGWQTLARNQQLLNDFADYAFDYGNFSEAMGFYLSACNSKVPEERAWYVRWLGSRAGAYGRYGLDSDDGRLVSKVSGGATASAPAPKNRAKLTNKTPTRKIWGVEQLLKETEHTSAHAPDQITRLQSILDEKRLVISPR